MDHLDLTRGPDQIFINKKKRTCQHVDFAIPVDHKVKMKEKEKIEKHMNLARESWKSVKHESNVDADCSWCP